jgi:hypothetical protein
MAQACNNIGKELSSSPSSSWKQRKSNSPQERKKSLKRPAPTSCSSSPAPPTKKSSIPQSSFMFDSLYSHHLNKIYSSPSTFDLSLLSTTPLNYSAFSPIFPRSSYLMDSILSSPFVCNWMNSTISDGFCGKRFTNHIHLLEHLCTEHTSIKSLFDN